MNADISKLQKAIGEAAIQAQQAQLKKQRDEKIELLIKLQASGFEKSTAYTNIILLGGYAGAFTLLQSTKEYIPDSALVLSALLLAFSIVIFCGWEISKMVLYARHNQKVLPLVQTPMEPEVFNKKLEELQKTENLSNLRFGKWWGAVLVLAVIPAFSAAAILLYAYVTYLIK